MNFATAGRYLAIHYGTSKLLFFKIKFIRTALVSKERNKLNKLKDNNKSKNKVEDIK